MSKITIFKEHKLWNNRQVIDYEKCQRIYDKLVESTGVLPTYPELAKAFNTDIERTKRISFVTKFKMRTVRGGNMSSCDFARTYEEMCEHGNPTHAQVAKKLGLSISAAQQRVDRYKRIKLEQLVAENTEKKQAYEVYAGPDTMRMLVDRVNRRTHI